MVLLGCDTIILRPYVFLFARFKLRYDMPQPKLLPLDLLDVIALKVSITVDMAVILSSDT